MDLANIFFYQNENHRTRMTEQVVINTNVEERVMNEYHTFELKAHVEYYLTFTLPPVFRERDIDRHIFQVNLVSGVSRESLHGSVQFQVDFESDDATEKFPIDVTIRQMKRITSYQLPAVFRDKDGK